MEISTMNNKKKKKRKKEKDHGRRKKKKYVYMSICVSVHLAIFHQVLGELGQIYHGKSDRPFNEQRPIVMDK
jgi:hypothetical protein